MHKLSESGRRQLRNEEGWRETPYKCAAGKWTVGYGHRLYPGDKVPGLIYLKPLDKWIGKITRATGDALLVGDVVKCENVINKYVKVPLNQNQVDALVVFIFNIGVNAFVNSTCLAYLNQKLYGSAAQQMTRWVHDDNRRKIPGLVARQNRTAELFKRGQLDE